MLFALREGLALALLAAPAPSGGVAVVYTPSVAAHREFVAALERRDPSVVALAVGDVWSKPIAPRAAIAVGNAAATQVDHAWPELPRAHLLQWQALAPAGALELVSSVHPEAQCTAELLRAAVGGDGWMILAPPTDHGALLLATALGAELVFGDARDHHRALRTRSPDKVWLRGHPGLARTPEWLELLGQLGRSELAYVGSDLPALRGLGIAAPIQVDVEVHAEAASDWIEQVRKRRTRKPTTLEVECKAT